MTLSIDLSPAEEARLSAVARKSGLTLDGLAKKLVTEHWPLSLETPDVREAARIAAIHAARGSMAHIGTNSEDLHRERQADKQKEEILNPE